MPGLPVHILNILPTLKTSLLAQMPYLSAVHLVLQGGNDYEIFMSERTHGHTVNSPIDTVNQCTELFIKNAKVPV